MSVACRRSLHRLDASVLRGRSKTVVKGQLICPEAK